MQPADLEYTSLQKLIGPYSVKGRTESASFLNWFLENIYRLDDVAADDAICDKPNDKGIDGIQVDEINEEINERQGKVRQKANSTLGDTDLKEFAGTLSQLATPANIDLILNGMRADKVGKQMFADPETVLGKPDGLKNYAAVIQNLI